MNKPTVQETIDTFIIYTTDTLNSLEKDGQLKLLSSMFATSIGCVQIATSKEEALELLAHTILQIKSEDKS